MLQTIVQFIAHLHSTCPAFRDFCSTQQFIQELFGILFPVVCSSDHVSAETELNSRDSALTFDGGDVVIRPLVSTSTPPIVRTTTVEDRPLSPGGTRPERLRRGSSFILVTREMGDFEPSSAKLNPGIASNLNLKISVLGGTSALVESLMELVTSIFLDMIIERRDFQGFGLNSKVLNGGCCLLWYGAWANARQVPPGFQEHQIFFETYLLRNTLNHLNNFISFDMKKLAQPKILTNIARYAVYMADCIYEGKKSLKH